MDENPYKPPAAPPATAAELEEAARGFFSRPWLWIPLLVITMALLVELLFVATH